MKITGFVFTYTNLHVFEKTCQFQFFRTYVKKDIPYKATPDMEFGKQAHTALEYRVSGGKPLPLEMQQWESFAAAFDGWTPKTEMQLAITREARPTEWFAKDVWGRGQIDVAVIRGDRASIHDWKTGKSKYEAPFQLEINALMLKIAYPSLQHVVGNFIYLKENRAGKSYDLSDFNGTWNRVAKLNAEIESKMISGEWEKNRTPLCAWCRVFDCEFNTNGDRDA